MKIFINQKPVKINPQSSIGKGCEADIYDLGHNIALKLFKLPVHQDFTGLADEQQAAQIRIAEHQQKLPAFPRHLPENVVSPIDLATDGRKGTIVGYTMPLLKHAQPLMRFNNPKYVVNGSDIQDRIKWFVKIHQTVAALHDRQIIIGDFNDLNVLIYKNRPYLIDADSFQFSNFICRMYTSRFIDPILCDPNASLLQPIKPYVEDSDWYAFTVMLFSMLLVVDPYGGIYRPKYQQNQLLHHMRPLHRITVYHPDVRYPKNALHFGALPDEFNDYFINVFEKDQRHGFPLTMLHNLHPAVCKTCHKLHYRLNCPNCSPLKHAPSVPLIVVQNKVKARKLFTTHGIILDSCLSHHQLSWLYHANGQYKRENGQVIIKGDYDPALICRMQGNQTYLGRQGHVYVLTGSKITDHLTVDRYYQYESIFDVNEMGCFWIQNGQLMGQEQFGPRMIGHVLDGKTRFWTGPTFGFGFYHSGEIKAGFVFDTLKGRLNDTVVLSIPNGQLIDSACYFSNDLCWFLISIKTRHQVIHQCMAIDRCGKVFDLITAKAGDDTWLGSIRGKCAMHHFLLNATGSGIVRVELVQGKITECNRFSDTQPFCDSSSNLHLSPQGLYCVGLNHIFLLNII